MKLTRRELIALISLGAVAECSRADDFISIVAKDKTDPTKACGITLILSTKTWQKSEPAGRTHFFKTQKGSYQVAPAPNIVELLDANKKIAGNLENLNPATAKKGDKGNGKSFETAVIYDWEVQ